jgi:hypothetical protein
MGALHWLRTADGQFRLSWRAASATAASPAQISKLEPIDLPGRANMWPMDPQVMQDDADRFHLVLNDVHRGITYATSDDGKKWADPLLLVDKPANSGLAQPRLFIDGKRVALIHQHYQTTYLRRGTLADIPALSPAVQITSGTTWRQIDGQIIAFTSSDTPLLLRAKLAALLEAP